MRESLNFGTQNVFYVEPEQPLRIYDLYSWSYVELDVHHLQLLFDPSQKKRITEQVNQALSLWLKKEKRNPEHAKTVVQQFLTSPRYHKCTPESRFASRLRVGQQTALFWVRLSDQPLESFAQEDYVPPPQPVATPPADRLTPVSVGILLSSLADYELNLPFEKHQAAFNCLFLPENAIRTSRLPDDKLLPLTREFCGTFGSSAFGNLINYTHHGTISEQNLAAVPLYASNPHHFVTLYFSLATPLEYDVAFPVPRTHWRQAPQLLRQLDFTPLYQEGENVILTRDQDLIHYYGNVPGQETLGERFLPPFIVLVSHQGRHEPSERSKLEDEFLRLFASAP